MWFNLYIVLENSDRETCQVVPGHLLLSTAKVTACRTFRENMPPIHTNIRVFSQGMKKRRPPFQNFSHVYNRGLHGYFIFRYMQSIVLIQRE
jgi:hypothetical protein